jgi:hypothetical protein
MGGVAVGDDEQPIRLARVEGHALGRTVDREPSPAEDEEIEVELAGAPAFAVLASEHALELLESDQERGRARRRVWPGWHVKRDHRIPERWLIDDADGSRDVEARYLSEADAGQGRERADAAGERVGRVAEVRPEPDVCPDASQVGPPEFPTLSRVVDVAVLILHPQPAGRAGEIESWVAASRAAIAERHRLGFLAAGAGEVTVLAGPPDGMAFGARLRDYVAAWRPRGLVVLGSGAIPLATTADRRAFVEAAASTELLALANNRYSADVVAVAAASNLMDAGDLASDNMLPRWLSEVAGYEVADLGQTWRLGFDIDGPLDVVVLGGRSWLPRPPGGIADRVVERLAAIRAAAHDPHAELAIAGRLSAAGLAWLERATASRTRALIEERGFRTRPAGQRPVRSSLGLLLDRDGPAALGAILAELGDAAIVDTRVLLAHRFGAEERAWPVAEDRYASDLLMADRIGDPWLRSLTLAARDASIPIVLGGHSLVGPGLRLALGKDRSWT